MDWLGRLCSPLERDQEHDASPSAYARYNQQGTKVCNEGRSTADAPTAVPGDALDLILLGGTAGGPKKHVQLYVGSIVYGTSIRRCPRVISYDQDWCRDVLYSKHVRR